MVVINLSFCFLLIFRVLLMFVTFYFGQAVEQSLEHMTVRMEEMTLRMNEAEQHWQELIKTMESDAFYRRLDRSKPAHIDELRAYTTRVDSVRYEQELKTQLALFGKAVVTSLERTMGHYLKVGSCNRAFSLPNTLT